MNEVLTLVLGYLVVTVLIFVLLNFLTSGFILKFIIVKAGRGNKALVEIYGVANVYYKIGKFDGEMLIYKNNEGKQKRLIIEKDQIVRVMNVPSIKVDDETNAILKADFSKAEGFDAIKFDSLMVRALTMPQIENQKEKLIFLAVLIFLIVAVGFLGYKIVNMEAILLKLAGRGTIN